MRQTYRFFSSRRQNEIHFVGLLFSLAGKIQLCDEMLGSAFFSVISDMNYFSQILLVYTGPIQEVKNLNRTTVCFLKRKLAYLTVIITVRGQTLSRSYGRCIAEFLNEESLVRLGLLDLSTCVGLRYG